MERKERQSTKDKPTIEAEDQRSILCDAKVEHADRDVFFATGLCRFCHETLESEK